MKYAVRCYSPLCCAVCPHRGPRPQHRRLTLKEARQIALANRPLVRASDLSVAAASQNTVQVQSARYPQLSASITAADCATAKPRWSDGKEVTLDTRIAAGGLNNPIVLRRDAAACTSASWSPISAARPTWWKAQNARRRSNIRQTRRARRLFSKSVTPTLARSRPSRCCTLRQRRWMREAPARPDLGAGQEQDQVRARRAFAQVNLGEARLLLLGPRMPWTPRLPGFPPVWVTAMRAASHLVDESTAPPLAISIRCLAQAWPRVPSWRACGQTGRPPRNPWMRRKHCAIRPSILYAAAGVTPYGRRPFPQYYGAIGVNLNVAAVRWRQESPRCKSKRSCRALALSENLAESENNVTDAGSCRVAQCQGRIRETSGSPHISGASASQALRLAESRYNLGITSIVELNQAQLSAIDAEIAYSRAKYDYLTARTELDYQAGALDPADAAR